MSGSDESFPEKGLQKMPRYKETIEQRGTVEKSGKKNYNMGDDANIAQRNESCDNDLLYVKSAGSKHEEAKEKFQLEEDVN